MLRGRRPADMLVLHLGENDVPMICAAKLTDLIVVDLHCLSQILPASQLAWVDLLPRRVWHGTVNSKVVDMARRKNNRMLHNVMQMNAGRVIGQSGICFGLPHLFRVDGVHLSPEGCDMYLTNTAMGIEAVFNDVDGMGESS